MPQITQLPTVPATDIRSTSALILNTTDSNGQVYTGRVPLATFNTGNGMNAATAFVTIPTADVLALFATPIQFGITVESGFAIQILSAQMKAIYNGVAYATNTNITVGAVGATDVQVKGTSFLSFNTDTFAPLAIQAGAANAEMLMDGADLEVSVATGNPTAGDSDLTIYVTYILLEI